MNTTIITFEGLRFKTKLVSQTCILLKSWLHCPLRVLASAAAHHETKHPLLHHAKPQQAPKVWLEYASLKHHHALQCFPTKQAEWIGENLQVDLGFTLEDPPDVPLKDAWYDRLQLFFTCWFRPKDGRPPSQGNYTIGPDDFEMELAFFSSFEELQLPARGPMDHA